MLFDYFKRDHLGDSVIPCGPLVAISLVKELEDSFSSGARPEGKV
jgi:hypothetical protein